MCRFSCNFQFKRRQALLSFVSVWLTTRRLGNRNWEHLVICFSGHNSRNGAATDRAVAVEMKASQPNFFFWGGPDWTRKMLAGRRVAKKEADRAPLCVVYLEQMATKHSPVYLFHQPPPPPN